MDLRYATPRELTHTVRVVCSQFGDVRNVSLHLYPCLVPDATAMAIVEMSSPMGAEAVRTRLGDGSFGTGVVVPLVQSPRLD